MVPVVWTVDCGQLPPGFQGCLSAGAVSAGGLSAKKKVGRTSSKFENGQTDDSPKASGRPQSGLEVLGGPPTMSKALLHPSGPHKVS